MKFGNWGNKPIATYDWVWPVLIPSGKLAANLESMGQSLGDSFIPAAHASAAMPEGSLPLGFSAQEFTQARNLFKDSGLLNQATPQVLTAALFMQQDPDDLFDLGANARSITEPHLHRTLREALSVTTPDAKQRSATLQQLVGSGLLGDQKKFLLTILLIHLVAGLPMILMPQKNKRRKKLLMTCSRLWIVAEQSHRQQLMLSRS